MVSALTLRLTPGCEQMSSTGRDPETIDVETFVDEVWESESVERFRSNLLDWYRRHRRELPWRGEGVSPYETCVAEVMLQQTQVSTVIDYYRRWLERFPDVEALADADRDDVM